MSLTCCSRARLRAQNRCVRNAYRRRRVAWRPVLNARWRRDRAERARDVAIAPGAACPPDSAPPTPGGRGRGRGSVQLVRAPPRAPTLSAHVVVRWPSGRISQICDDVPPPQRAHALGAPLRLTHDGTHLCRARGGAAHGHRGGADALRGQLPWLCVAAWPARCSGISPRPAHLFCASLGRRSLPRGAASTFRASVSGGPLLAGFFLPVCGRCLCASLTTPRSVTG